MKKIFFFEKNLNILHQKKTKMQSLFENRYRYEK
jgi:hypothetical protein